MATIMTKRGQLDNVVTYEHICDTVADMANINPSYVTLGSVCIVIKGENDDLEVYMADSRKEWKIISSSTGESGSISSSGIYICAQDEYDSVTGMPTIEDPLSNTFYLTPGGDETNDLYNEWIWLEDDEEWEKFGSATTAISQSDWNQLDSSADDFIKNKPAIRQQANGGGILENGATSASGQNSHAEGGGTTASGAYSHAEGGGTEASGSNSHAEGGGATASGRSSHAEGGNTVASGDYSHAEGSNTTANHMAQHVFGMHNIPDSSTESAGAKGNYVEIVGNGLDTNRRSNARTLDWNGNEEVAGDVKANACGGANPISLIAVSNSVQNKLDKNQGAAYSGKFMGINNSGNIVPLDVEGGNIAVTEELISGEDYELSIREGETSGVVSVAGKTGTVTLNSNDVAFNDAIVYNDGTVGAGLTNLKSHLNELLPTNLIDSITDLNKYVSYNDGKLYNSTTANVTGYIDISNYTDLVYSQTNLPSSSSYWGIAFYDNDKVYISGVRCVRNAPSNFYTESDVNVPQNAKYIRMTVFHTSAVNGAEPYLYDKEDFDSSLPRRVQSVESELSILSTEFEGVKKDGCYTIPVDKWAVGGWLSYNSSDSRQYRVRCDEALEFDCDTFILADVGYKVSGYKLVNGSSVGLDDSTILKIPANTSVKIYARRFTEDTSEVVSNVTPFANAIKFSTALAPIELYQPTFTDVSMFERMGVGGDSYANGGGYISGIRSLTWGKNLERQAGITVDIYARSGEDVVGWNTDSTRGLPALLSGEECGLYWLQHGINGTRSAEAIGTPEDMFTSPHPSTFYGQYVEAIEQIKTTFPKARIVIATIIGSDWELAQNTQYSAVNTAVKNIAQYCEIPVIDISTDDFFRSLFYRNGIQSNHPSAMLCAGMAMAYRRLISKCIQENPSYFLEYGFTE